MFEWIWYVKFACVMFGCWVIFLEKYNFHIVFSMVYESIVNDVNGSVASSGILWNVDSIVLKLFCMVNSVYFVQDNSLNNYFRSSAFSPFYCIFEVNFLKYHWLKWFLILPSDILCIQMIWNAWFFKKHKIWLFIS
jgi:hypothetical protein